jgi:hypothetical protein
VERSRSNCRGILTSESNHCTSPQLRVQAIIQ